MSKKNTSIPITNGMYFKDGQWYMQCGNNDVPIHYKRTGAENMAGAIKRTPRMLENERRSYRPSR